MKQQFDRIKNHVKENKKTYVASGVSLIAGAMVMYLTTSFVGPTEQSQADGIRLENWRHHTKRRPGQSTSARPPRKPYRLQRNRSHIF